MCVFESKGLHVPVSGCMFVCTRCTSWAKGLIGKVSSSTQEEDWTRGVKWGEKEKRVESNAS